MSLLRRRAEARLWQERRDAATVRRFVGDEPPSAIGRLALARVAAGRGRPRRGRERGPRGVAVGAAVGRARDRRARRVSRRADPRRPRGAHGPAHRRQGSRRRDARRQARRRRSGRDRQGVRRRAGEIHQGRHAARCGAAPSARDGSGLRAVPPSLAHAQRHAGLEYQRPHRDAQGGHRGCGQARARRAAGGSAAPGHRRMVARASRARPQAARPGRCSDRLRGGARRGALPANPYYRADFHFMAGWIALRFLGDPATARGHFAHIDDGRTDPIVLARAAYWRGRAAEAAGQLDEMQARVRGRRPLSDRLLRPAGARPARLRRRRGGAPAARTGGRATRTSRCTPRRSSMRSASATSSCRS